MNASKILMDEHDKILEMLRVLEQMCLNIENNAMPPLEHLAQAVDFIRGFADRCHHAKEENLLFPAMEEAGIPKESGPIRVMLADHAAGSGHVRLMEVAVVKIKNGNSGGFNDFVQHASDYIQLLSGHIYKENNILFPMGDRFLSEEKQRELLAGFEQVEKEDIGQVVHEKYHKLLNDLKKIYLKQQ